MRHFLLFFLLLCCSKLIAQDTIYGEPKIVIDTVHFSPEIMELTNYYSACIHGHECCSSGCPCCPQLHREQRYDTIFYSYKNDVQRITVVERYFFAKSNDILPVHHRFRKKDGEWSKKYYRADLSREGSSNWGDGWSRYPEQDEKKYQKNNRALVIDETGDCSMIDLQGNQLKIPFAGSTHLGNNIYISCFVLNDTYIYGFSDGNGNKIGPLKYRSIGEFNESGIAIAVVNQQIGGWHRQRGFYSHENVGLVNCAGMVVLPCTYSQIEEIGPDRYAAVCENGRNIIINAVGEEISKVDYLGIYKYSEGLAFARKDSNRSVFIDTNGNEVFECTYEWSYGFKDGLAAVTLGRKWGFIDKTGKLVIPLQFDQAKSFSDGAAPVSVGTDSNRDQWKLIDKSGNYTTTKVYDEISEFKNGLARAWINGVGSTLIDTKGKELFPCNYILDGYGTDDSWYINGMLIRSTVRKDSTLEVIDEHGRRILDLKGYFGAGFIRDPSYQSYRYYPFLLVSKRDHTAALVDFKGKELISGAYKHIGVPSDSIAIGYMDTEVDVIDIQSGKAILTYPKNEFYGVDRGVIKLKDPNNPYGYQYFNLKGEKLKMD